MTTMTPRAPASRPGPAPSGAVGGVLAFVGLLTWTALLLVLCLLGPKFEQIFRDFGVALPWPTRVGIGVSRWLTGRGVGQTYPGIVLVAPLLLGVTFAFFCARRSWALALLFMLAGVVLLIGELAVNYDPLITMIDSLQITKP